jgi:hypothetical protein
MSFTIFNLAILGATLLPTLGLSPSSSRLSSPVPKILCHRLRLVRERAPIPTRTLKVRDWLEDDDPPEGSLFGRCADGYGEAVPQVGRPSHSSQVEAAGHFGSTLPPLCYTFCTLLI